jgi:hypothetical protein
VKLTGPVEFDNFENKLLGTYTQIFFAGMFGNFEVTNVEAGCRAKFCLENSYHFYSKVICPAVSVLFFFVKNVAHCQIDRHAYCT